MSEELLYYIWQQKLFNTHRLKTTQGEDLSIIHCGIRNHDAGPDFTQAKIRINGDLLAGNVEIHVRSSDWKKHKHQSDRAYSNVILHVVYDDEMKSDSACTLPTLELKDKIELQFLSRYRQLMASSSWIPCESQIARVDEFIIKSGLHRILIERLEQKTGDIIGRFRQNKNNWEETFYQITARNFGLKINADTFDLLAKSLPLGIIARHKNSLAQIEALVFGQAGMLHKTFNDDYPRSLKKEYLFLKKKYNLEPLQPHLWKFMRLRPPGFPTIRLAQFSMLLHSSTHLFSKMLDAESARQIAGLFRCEPSSYWLNHYRFDTASKNIRKPVGEDFIQTLIINAVIPMMFIYGKSKGNSVIQDKALNFLEQLSSEKNAIISKWRSLGIKSGSAFESQALLQLKNQYCSHKRCLDCFVGNQILR